MDGSDVIIALKRKFRVSTDQALADRIGLTVPGIQLWKNREKITSRQLAALVHKAAGAGASNLQASAIRPVVEFFPVTKDTSVSGTNCVLFNLKGAKDGRRNQYLEGLRGELESHSGVYIFFDSRGQAIYAGKARKQSLWKEMNLAFNRPRGAVQKIKRVTHPKRNQPYRTSNEKARQIVEHVVPLHELAYYFSAYEVADGMIGEVEAMLLRSFANDLLNTRMERFGQQRKPR